MSQDKKAAKAPEHTALWLQRQDEIVLTDGIKAKFTILATITNESVAEPNEVLRAFAEQSQRFYLELGKRLNSTPL